MTLAKSCPCPGLLLSHWLTLFHFTGRRIFQVAGSVISASTSQELRDSGSHDDEDYGRRVGLLCEWQKGKWQLTFGLESLLSEKGPVSLMWTL